MRPLEDDQALLGTLLDDTLRHHLGEGTVARLDRLRELSKAYSSLSSAGLDEAAQGLYALLQDELSGMPEAEVVPIIRFFGNYLNLTGIAENHNRVRWVPPPSPHLVPPGRRGIAG